MDIPQLLQLKGLSQAQGAAALGMSPGALSNLIKGRRGADIETIAKIVMFSIDASGVALLTADDVIRPRALALGFKYPQRAAKIAGANGNGVVSARGAEKPNPGETKWQDQRKSKRSAAAVARRKQRKTKR